MHSNTQSAFAFAFVSRRRLRGALYLTMVKSIMQSPAESASDVYVDVKSNVLRWSLRCGARKRIEFSFCNAVVARMPSGFYFRPHCKIPSAITHRICARAPSESGIELTTGQWLRINSHYEKVNTMCVRVLVLVLVWVCAKSMCVRVHRNIGSPECRTRLPCWVLLPYILPVYWQIILVPDDEKYLVIWNIG